LKLVRKRDMVDAAHDRIREDAMQEVATGFGLVEAPLWIDGQGLYFSDVLNGGVHLLDARREVSLVLPKRRGVGGMAGTPVARTIAKGGAKDAVEKLATELEGYEDLHASAELRRDILRNLAPLVIAEAQQCAA